MCPDLNEGDPDLVHALEVDCLVQKEIAERLLEALHVLKRAKDPFPKVVHHLKGIGLGQEVKLL